MSMMMVVGGRAGASGGRAGGGQVRDEDGCPQVMTVMMFRRDDVSTDDEVIRSD